MAVLLALASAVAYGISDFVGGLVSRKASPWAVALAAQVGGLAAILALTLFVDGSPTSTDLWWAALAGLGNGFGTAFLYRGLSSGRMGVVAPISGVGAALVPVAAGLLGGERPAGLVWLGILAALPGIWLVASEPSLDDAEPRIGLGEGILDGVLAGLGFGVLFAALGQIPESAGLVPLAVNQATAVPVIVGVALLLRNSWIPRTGAAYAGLLCGLLGATATGAFLLAVQSGYLTVSAILASLYPAFTVLLAVALLREHVHRAQAAGLVLCGLAVALVASG